jgi:hypothetical protein
VSTPERRVDVRGPSEEPPADEEYARTYASGYEEGLRSALREVLEHLTRGHTPQEVRMLVQGRLARLAEEVELKRRALLAPPRRTNWGPAPRFPGTTVSAPPTPAPVGLERGRSVLVREERPNRALAILRAEAARFPRTVIVSARPPELPAPLAARATVIPVGAGAGEGTERLTLGEVGGRLKEPTEGGALVYVDALEFFVLEDGPDVVARFVHWLVEQVQRTGSALVVSLDPRALEAREASRLERAFGQVVGGA